MAFCSQGEVSNSQELIGEKVSKSQGNEYGQPKSGLAMNLQEIFLDTKTRLVRVKLFSIYRPNNSSENLIPQMFHPVESSVPCELKDAGLVWSSPHISDFGFAMRLIVHHKRLIGVKNFGNPNRAFINKFAKAAGNSDGKIFPNWDSFNLSSRPDKDGKIPSRSKLLGLIWAIKSSDLSDKG